MNTNNNYAPEKIYVHKSQHWGLMANEHNITKNGIEYTRTDAFIEKACEYFAPHIKDNSGGYDRAFVFENFKKYMRGE